MKRTDDLVALAAIINASEDRLREIDTAARRIGNWEQLIARAEREGIAPMLYRHLRRADSGIAPAAMNALRALAVRHRHATETRLAEFCRMSAALSDRGIDSAALKGVALAGLIYPEPGLRPMRDIDFLVPSAHAQAARAVLETLGYRFEAHHPSPYMRLHHHLPNASCTVDGLKVSVEIHTRANSGDTPGARHFHSLLEPLQEVTTPFGVYRTLGHLDMLNQLCRHALEPGETIRLVSVMDIQGYVERFDRAIDWQSAARHHPYIANFLRLTDPVAPLPDKLARFHYEGPALPEPGRLIPTAGAVFACEDNRIDALRKLANPPPWWFRSYYGVGDDDRGLLRAKLSHLARIGIWMSRRAISSLVSSRSRDH